MNLHVSIDLKRAAAPYECIGLMENRAPRLPRFWASRSIPAHFQIALKKNAVRHPQAGACGGRVAGSSRSDPLVGECVEIILSIHACRSAGDAGAISTRS